MLKKLLVGIVAAAMLFAFTPTSQSDAAYYVKLHGQKAGTVKWFKNAHPPSPSEWELIDENCNGCFQVDADADAGVSLNGTVVDAKVNQRIENAFGPNYAGAQSEALVEIGGSAIANAKDSWQRVWVKTGRWFWQGHYERVFVPGTGEADAFLQAIQKFPTAVVIMNGPQTEDWSYTYIKSMADLDIIGEAWATGTKGCPQIAILEIAGDFSAYAFANAVVEHNNGISFAQTGGHGMTTVSFEGYESDLDYHGHAKVDFDTTISVEQDITVKSYVSPDGATTKTFGIVTGGSAESFLGVDKWFIIPLDYDNIELTGITAKGSVQQSAMATNGQGAFAYGSSFAKFTGATGLIADKPAWCFLPSPGQTANVGGLAKVDGYNNVEMTSQGLVATSHQHAYASTQNSGPIQEVPR